MNDHMSIDQNTPDQARYGTDQPWYVDMPTVAEWRRSLGNTAFKHAKVKKRGTRETYSRTLGHFNAWLHGREFDVYTYDRNDQVVKIKIGFKNVEEMMAYLEGPTGRVRHAQRIIKRYLYDSMHKYKKSETMRNERSAILSYFEYNDFGLHLRFDAKKTYNSEPTERLMTLSDMGRILYCTNVRNRAMLLCMFHRGLDSSTMLDRFNHEAFEQIAKYFETTDHSKWDVYKCPVPVRLMRIKTKYEHTGFLERDAIKNLSAYLDERKKKTGRDMTCGEPLFLNKMDEAINTAVLIYAFNGAAKRAGVRFKTGKMYNMSLHEMRDLLKSTLINAGCRYDVADHAIGHKPKDSYEKQFLLYPETARNEYAKAAKRINVLESIQKAINSCEEQDTKSKVTGLVEEHEYRAQMDAENVDSRTIQAEKKLKESQKINEFLQKKIDVLQNRT